MTSTSANDTATQLDGQVASYVSDLEKLPGS